jgi:hypothetical protein
VDVFERVETPDRVVVGFHQRGRHVGPLTTPLGVVPPTGRTVQRRIIDILTVADGLVTAVWVVSDDFDLLTQLDALRLTHEGVVLSEPWSRLGT